MNNLPFKKRLIDSLYDALQHKSFTKKGNVFSARYGDITYFICLQSTIDSTPERLQVTVNVETSSRKLYMAESIDIPEELYRTSIMNIGEYGGMRDKKWWVIKDEASLRAVSDEIIRILFDSALPAFKPAKINNWFHRFAWPAAS